MDGTQVLVRQMHGSQAELDQLIRQVEAELAREGRPRQGPPMVVVRSPSSSDGESPAPAVAFELMLSVPPGTAAPEGFEVRSLPPQPVAYTIHHGRAENLESAEAVLADWVRMKALKFAGELRRVYIKRGKNPKKDITELQIPLER